MNAMYVERRFSFIAQNNLAFFGPSNEYRWISAYPSTTKRPSANAFSSASRNTLYNINSIAFSLSVLFPITSTVDLRQEHPRFESKDRFHPSILPFIPSSLQSLRSCIAPAFAIQTASGFRVISKFHCPVPYLESCLWRSCRLNPTF